MKNTEDSIINFKEEIDAAMKSERGKKIMEEMVNELIATEKIISDLAAKKKEFKKLLDKLIGALINGYLCADDICYGKTFLIDIHEFNSIFRVLERTHSWKNGGRHFDTSVTYLSRRGKKYQFGIMIGQGSHLWVKEVKAKKENK